MNEQSTAPTPPKPGLGGTQSPPPADPTASAENQERLRQAEEDAAKLAAEGGAPPGVRKPADDDPALADLTDEERRRVTLGLPKDAPEALVEAAEGRLQGDGTEQGEIEANQKEVAVLDFILGATKALEYDVDALVDTPDGPGVLVFHFRQLRDTEIEAMEKEHMTGEGPMAQVDRASLNAKKVARAVTYMKDGTGKVIPIADPTFMGQGIGDPYDAVKARFQYQPGVITGVAQEIDAAAGMVNNRVGFARVSSITAEQAIADAVGKS